MIKMLQWVYNLGRQHERMRLKRLALEHMVKQQNAQDSLQIQLDRTRDASLPNRDTMEFNRAVNSRVALVLDRMIFTKYQEDSVPDIDNEAIK